MTGLVDRFVEQVVANSGFEEMDALYLRNRVLALVGDQVLTVQTDLEDLIELKDELLAHGVRTGFVGELLEEQDMVGSCLMDLMTPSPSQVNRDFWQIYQDSPEQAIGDFYELSKRNDYIKMAAIAKNIYYQFRQSMRIWKSRSICPNLRRIPSLLQLLRKLKRAIIPNAYSVWKMRAIRVGLIILHAPTTALFAWSLDRKSGASSIRPMLTTMNMLFS